MPRNYKASILVYKIYYYTKLLKKLMPEFSYSFNKFNHSILLLRYRDAVISIMITLDNCRAVRLERIKRCGNTE